jgi:hypothetical protein
MMNEIDEIARASGKEVIRLPPYHSYMNLIEHIWSQFKDKVRKRNCANVLDKKTHLRVAEEMASQVFSEIPNESVTNTFEHAEKIWRQYASGEAIVHVYEDAEISNGAALTDADKMIYVDD